MIPENKLQEVRDQLDKSLRSIFFFDDDADGLASFIILYHSVNEAKGIPIKAAPVVNEEFVRFVHEFSPERIFVLDNSRVTDEFVEGVRTPITVLDHHTYEQVNGIKFYNPRDYDPDKNFPTTYLAYKITQNKDDLWIAMLGCVADWVMPDFKDEFCDKYPDLLDRSITKPDDALFDSEIGKLSRVFFFALKGSTKSVLANMKTLTRIKSPYELLHETTPAGKFIMKHFKKYQVMYDAFYARAKQCVTNDRFAIFAYEDANMSMTAELSNELIHRHPDKVVIVARIKNGEYRCSLRGAGKTMIAPALKRALESVEGTGGGHEQACGASVKEEDFSHFVELLREFID